MVPQGIKMHGRAVVGLRLDASSGARTADGTPRSTCPSKASRARAIGVIGKMRRGVPSAVHRNAKGSTASEASTHRHRGRRIRHGRVGVLCLFRSLPVTRVPKLGDFFLLAIILPAAPFWMPARVQFASVINGRGRPFRHLLIASHAPANSRSRTERRDGEPG